MRLALTLACGIAASSTAAMAADNGGCEVVYQALLKEAITPNHQYIQRQEPGSKQPKSNEYIVMADASYLFVNGTWRRSPLSPKDNEARLKEAWSEKKVVACKMLREESLDGEAAVLYSAHDESEEGKSDSQIWISKKRGLPLKQVTDLWTGDGPKPDDHIITRFVYEGVKAPTGAK